MHPNYPAGLVEREFWALPLEFLPQWALVRLGIPISAKFPGGADDAPGWENTFGEPLRLPHSPPPPGALKCCQQKCVSSGG